MTLSTFAPKPKDCSHCGSSFTPVRPMQAVCSPICASRKVKLARKQERIQTRERKAAIQTLPELKRLAQQAFNAYCRERDRLAGHRCISSGKPLDWSGNGADAGHYRSVGSAPHLRYDERNCHAQSKQDNRWGAGRAVDYRIGLIARIGLAAVEALEADNTPRHYTHDELRAIRTHFKAKLAALKKEKSE